MLSSLNETLGNDRSVRDENSGHSDLCSLDSLACFFKPMSDKCEEQLRLGLVGEDLSCRQEMRRKHLSPIQKTSNGWACITMLKPGQNSTGPLARYSPSTRYGYVDALPVPYKSRGLFWFSSHLLAHLMRPNRALQVAILDAKEDARWKNVVRPLISLHVRRGDSCSPSESKRTARVCDDLDVYMKSVLRLSKRLVVLNRSITQLSHKLCSCGVC